MNPRWLSSALRDLDSAHDFIAAANPPAAAATIDRIESAANALAEHPHLGRVGRVAGTRELIVARTPFIVAYRVMKGRVEILAVIHAARRWPGSL